MMVGKYVDPFGSQISGRGIGPVPSFAPALTSLGDVKLLGPEAVLLQLSVERMGEREREKERDRWMDGLREGVMEAWTDG